ncbi:MAG: hypothetical protein OXI88_05150 [Gammaproteobacteria bacterium]|nr:hypothetical protein [Gammaproteobacteria bacterium]
MIAFKSKKSECVYSDLGVVDAGVVAPGGLGGLGGGVGFKAKEGGSGFEPFLSVTFFISSFVRFNKLNPLNIFSIDKYTI